MMPGNIPVKEINCLTDGELAESVAQSHEPLFLRGLVAEWPAVRESQLSSQALLAYIRKFYQGGEVGCFRAPAETQGRYFYREDMLSLNFEKSMTRLDSFLDEILASTTSPDRREFLYSGSENVNRILPGFSESNRLAFLDKLSPRQNIWIGNRSRIAAHYDMPSNIACCVGGVRRFTLLPPDQAENLYPGPLDFTPSGQSVSLVDFHHPEFDKYPRFKEAQEHMRVVELEPGDALFIPGMWWHHVEGFDDINVLVNFWWWNGPAYTDPPVNSLYYAMMNIKDLPVSQKKAWKTLFDLYVFNEDPNAFDYIPEQARGRLGVINEDGARYIRSMLLNTLNR